MRNFDSIFNEFKKTDNEIEYFGRILGKGSYGEIRDIKLKNSLKLMAAKLVKKKENEDDSGEAQIAKELHGPNIIKINKTMSKKINGADYELIIMEKAILRDLGKLNEYYYMHNLLKLIFQSFEEECGDNLLRFYAIQIIDGLEKLDRSYFVHFDLKPENILINLNLKVKISDFSLIKKVKNGQEIKIPGGTQGYLSPEYFDKEKAVSCDIARKQDYFALGCILYYLKYGKHMIKFKNFQEDIFNKDRIIEYLHKCIGYIKSRPLTDKGFIYFLISLIEYEPKERPIFEEIYRNKWLNKNKNVLENIINANENDEEKLIMELQKSDFLIKKEKNSNIKRKKYIFKKKNFYF